MKPARVGNEIAIQSEGSFACEEVGRPTVVEGLMMIEGAAGNAIGQRDKHAERIVVPAPKERAGLADEVAKLIDVGLAYLQVLRFIGHHIEIVLWSNLRS